MPRHDPMDLDESQQPVHDAYLDPEAREKELDEKY
jgi:hypothetical protein